ncbi:MAG: hypothetical protein ABSG10_12790 [Terracidiphilus sp.]|jgi:hypothetical protein
MERREKDAARRIPVLRKETKGKIVLPAPSPSASTLKEVHNLLTQYAAEMEQSGLSHSSKAMYIDFADCFVRWMNGGFQPGMRKSGKLHSNIV